MGLLGAVCDLVDLFNEFRHMSVVLQLTKREKKGPMGNPIPVRR